MNRSLSKVKGRSRLWQRSEGVCVCFQWEAKPPVPSLCFKNIVKKVVKLHENVVDILPPQQVEVRRLTILTKHHIARQIGNVDRE